MNWVHKRGGCRYVKDKMSKQRSGRERRHIISFRFLVHLAATLVGVRHGSVEDVLLVITDVCAFGNAAIPFPPSDIFFRKQRRYPMNMCFDKYHLA